MIALLDAFFTAVGALSTVFACLFGVALLRESIRIHRGCVPVRQYPALCEVQRDEVAERRAMRSGGHVA